MNIDDIRTISVIGAGNMGHQISLHCALKGYEVICTDVNGKILKRADDFVDTYLAGRVEKKKLTPDEARAARNRIHFTPDLRTASGEADFIIEAVVEVLSLKRKLFADIDRIAPAHAILATNSSAIVSSRLADVTSRPEKVLNVHFFNPALVMKLVEVVQGPHVSDETAGVAMALCERLGKVSVHVKKEVAGFLLNRIIKVIGGEAQWLLEMGVASMEDIDKACVHGAGHPMGPFRLMDLTGIDLAYDMGMGAFQSTGDPAELPRPSLVARYARGEYGEKTGRGWYDYTRK